MHTVELLISIIEALQRNPQIVYEININDIRELIYLDIQCRRQLYTVCQFKKLENFFEDKLTNVSDAFEKCNAYAALKAVEELKSYIEILPDVEYVSDFIECANMDHLRLEHILNKTVYAIGDSHVNFFSGNEELSFIPVGNGINTCKQVGELPFSVFHMGPSLAYNSDSYNTSSRFKEKLDYLLDNIIEADASIMFVLGEIDVRVHVFKECKKRACKYEDIVDGIVDRYMNMMLKVQARGYTVSCFGPIASQSDAIPADEEFVKCGTEIERNRATAYFTRILREKCKQEEIVFVSIFDKMITDDLQTKYELLCSDGCHLGQNALRIVIKELSDSGFNSLCFNAERE